MSDSDRSMSEDSRRKKKSRADDSDSSGSDRKPSRKGGKRRDDSDSESEDDRRDRYDDRDEKISRTITVNRDDAAFVLGRGGTTKRKIARVSGADIDLDENSQTITLAGTEKQCDRAQEYIAFVTQQRVGPVSIGKDRLREDFSAVPVPAECIGFVMGRAGQTLRSMEEEWGVLMFFANIQTAGLSADHESLCIFGPLASRRGAEVKVLSSIEHKSPGTWVSSRGELRPMERVEGDEDRDGWALDTVMLSEDNFSYALGAQGSTRKKLAAASGCIIEYVGRLACFCGYKRDRRRGKDYLRWLIEQRTGNSVVERPQDRDDCLVVKIPVDSIAFITGHRGESLRGIERETGTFCFTDGDRNDRSSKREENLLIFAFSRSAREHAADIVEDRIAQHKRMGGSRGREGQGRMNMGDRDDFGRDRDHGAGSTNRDRDRDRDRDSGRGRRRRDDHSDDDDDDDDHRRRRRDRSRSRSRGRRRR